MFYAEMAISSFCIWAPDLGYSKLDISFRSLMSTRFDNNAISNRVFILHIWSDVSIFQKFSFDIMIEFVEK